LLEIQIAAGRRSDIGVIGKPVALTCPDCGGVLSEVKGMPLRFRCQVGHAHTSRTLLQRQEAQVDEAMRVALRIIEERAELVSRMSRDASQVGRTATAEMYSRRASEYHGYADQLRQAVLHSMGQPSALGVDTGTGKLEALGQK